MDERVMVLYSGERLQSNQTSSGELSCLPHGEKIHSNDGSQIAGVITADEELECQINKMGTVFVSISILGELPFRQEKR